MFYTKFVEKFKTHILSSTTPFFEYRDLYEIMRKNIVNLYRPQLTVRCKCIACWIPKVTNTLSEYVILIDFRMQQ